MRISSLLFIACFLLVGNAFGQISVLSSSVPSFTTASQGDLYVDENDVYYIGLDDGSLKEIGIVTAKGTTHGQVLAWDSVSQQWLASSPSAGSFPQLLLDANRTSTYTAPTGSSYSTLPFNNEVIDLGNNYNSSTGVFVAPADGMYEVIINNTYSTNTTTVGRIALRVVANSAVNTEYTESIDVFCSGIFANCGSIGESRGSISGSTMVELQSGQTLEIQVGNRFNTMTPVLGTGQHRLKIVRHK
jgi:hypothetical protein